MTESEQLAMLSPEDVAKLQTEKAPVGCLLILIAVLLIGGVLVGLFLDSSLVWVAGYAVISVAVFVGYFFFRKKANGLVDQDILASRKNVIIAPIESKRIESSEIRRGSRRGEITSSYYMTIRGVEYDMNESEYLEIRQGEFIEMHIAPISKTVLQQKWLRADGTSEIINKG